MTVVPVNIAEVTQAVKELFEAQPDMTDVEIQRSGEIAEGQYQGGWVGIYRSRVPFQIRALGLGSGFRQQRIELVVLVQANDLRSGEEAENRLEALVQKVAGALLSDTTLKGTVETIEDFTVTYTSVSRTGEGVYVQEARIDLVALVNVSVN